MKTYEKWERWYKFALWKAYFDEGYGFSSALKWGTAVIFGANAIIEKDLKLLIIIGFVYGIGCLLLGKFIFWSGLKEAIVEVSNRINPFVKEMRYTIINGKV